MTNAKTSAMTKAKTSAMTETKTPTTRTHQLRTGAVR
jgi:hypothetical protein